MTGDIDATAHAKALPMTVMSHATGGCCLGHVDTAITVADAGHGRLAAAHDHGRPTFS